MGGKCLDINFGSSVCEVDFGWTVLRGQFKEVNFERSILRG